MPVRGSYILKVVNPLRKERKMQRYQLPQLPPGVASLPNVEREALVKRFIKRTIEYHEGEVMSFVIRKHISDKMALGAEYDYGWKKDASGLYLPNADDD